MHIDIADKKVIKRVFARLVILLFLASLQWRSGIGKALYIIFYVTSMLNIIFALASRSKMLGKNLSFWDEALFFMALSIAAKILG